MLTALAPIRLYSLLADEDQHFVSLQLSERARLSLIAAASTSSRPTGSAKKGLQKLYADEQSIWLSRSESIITLLLANHAHPTTSTWANCSLSYTHPRI